MKKVVKFGGSSLADQHQFEKVFQIIKEDSTRHYVVPSAPGKRFKKDTKITDLLYKAYRHCKKDDFEEIFDQIKQRYFDIQKALNISVDLESEFTIIEENFKKDMGLDYAASRGEYLNGKLLAAYLGFEFIDAKEIIFIDENGKTKVIWDL